MPGCNIGDLVEAELIPDPFHRENHKQLRWIEERDWEYRSEFSITREQHGEHVDLVFEGLDTYATVRLNGEVILEANNAFRRYRVPCAHVLRAGGNELSVVFRSPVAETAALRDRDGIVYPAENDDSEEKTSAYVRKPAYHFGWDWAPRLVSSGIRQPVYLEVVPHCRIADVALDMEELSERSASLAFDVSIDSNEALDAVLNIRCANDAQIGESVAVALQPGGGHVRVRLDVDRPRRWWPHDIGEPFLYEFEFEILARGETVATFERRFGLRTIEFVNDPDAHGRAFFFRVNGVPVFMKGANYIPPDMFLDRMTRERYERIFRDAIDANFNMLRIWGGGAYETETFYDLADELGVLVWQDFMFANTLYPADDEFVDNVSGEVADVVRRLRHHASLALWCGNNEIEMGIECWEWPRKFGYTDAQFLALTSGYERLFLDVIPALIEAHDPARSDCYLASSPQSMWERPATKGQGNCHYWGVWHGGEDFSAYRDNVPRFMTEFGFQSLPAMVSTRKFSEPGDWDIDSPVMRAHQRHPTGNARIADAIKTHFGVVPGFEHFLYLSQVLQAEGLRIGIEAHRLARPYCMGSLYWQLNDAWPGASWSGIDYYGQWKALHYQARRSFAATELSVDQDGRQLDLHVINDRMAERSVSLSVSVRTFSGEPVFRHEADIVVPAGANIRAWSGSLDAVTAGSRPEDCVLVATLDTGGERITRHHYFCEHSKLRLREPNIAVDLAATASGRTVRLEAMSSLARFVHVWVDSAEVVNFSDNFFDLLPGRPVEIRVPPDVSIDRSALRISSLIDALSER